MSPQTFDLIPVVAITGGLAPLSSEADLGGPAKSVNASDAVESWIAQGARRLQVRDEDALAGTGNNRALIQRIIKRHHRDVKFDLVANTTSLADLDELMHTEVDRVLIETAVAADPALLAAVVARAPHRISLRLDVIGGTHLVAAGTALQGADLWSTLPSLEAAGVPHYTVTDLAHHDHWKHGNLHLMQTFCESSLKHATSGSGVKSLGDLHQLAELIPQGLDGAVIGHALDLGTFSFSDALAAMEARYDPYQWGPAQP